MTYVDDLVGCLVSPNWGHTRSCRLMADSEPELLEFGARIKCKPTWAHRSHRGMLHFDLTARMREYAIEAGAIPIDRKKVVELSKRGMGV